MDAATEERLNEAHSRIEILEAKAQEGTADAQSRMQGYIDALHREEQAVRDSAGTETGEKLEQLDSSIALAEHKVAVEVASTGGQFTGALEAEMQRWDAYLDRMQVKAAAKTGDARERAEASIADLRDHRVSIEARASAAVAASDEGWRDARSHVVAELGELQTKADTAAEE